MDTNSISGSAFIVEDEVTISYLIKLHLQNFFGEVQEFANGLEAMENIRKNKPALIVLDVMLPGMQGFEILEEIRETPALSDVKVLMLTAKSREKDLDRGFELDADEYMSKPFKMNELMLRVERLLK